MGNGGGGDIFNFDPRTNFTFAHAEKLLNPPSGFKKVRKEKGKTLVVEQKQVESGSLKRGLGALNHFFSFSSKKEWAVN